MIPEAIKLKFMKDSYITENMKAITVHIPFSFQSNNSR